MTKISKITPLSNRMKKLLLFTASACFLLSGCKKESENKSSLSVSPTNLTFTVAGETQTIDVTAYFANWSITGHEDADWITISPVSAYGIRTVSVTTSTNETKSGRSATLTFSAKDVKPTSVNINQLHATELKIISFEPTTACYDDTITIYGEKFEPTLTGNTVILNDITSEILSATTIKMQVKVPKDKNCSGLIKITTDGKTVMSETDFTYQPTNIVSTLSGNGKRGFADGASVVAQFNNPSGISMDASGNLFVADVGNHSIRKISPIGEVSTFAGNGTRGFNDGIGGEATFASPNSVAVDASGNTYVADRDNNCIRKISPSGEVSVFVGNRTAGFADGKGDEALFNAPNSVAIDALGNLYVADFNNHCIRKVSPSGVVSVFAGSGEKGFNNGNGTLATFNNPYGVAIDASGNLYVADFNNHSIRKISPDGKVITIAGNGIAGYVDGAAEESQFRYPRDMTIDMSGNVYVVDEGNNRIRVITPSGIVTTIAGSTIGYTDGRNEKALFSRPCGITIDASGNLYVADMDNQRIRQIMMEK